MTKRVNFRLDKSALLDDAMSERDNETVTIGPYVSIYPVMFRFTIQSFVIFPNLSCNEFKSAYRFEVHRMLYFIGNDYKNDLNVNVTHQICLKF